MEARVDAVKSASGGTEKQRRSALRRANAIRKARAQLKRDLKSGRTRIETLLAEPPSYLLSASVSELVNAVPSFGPARTAQVLARCRISPTKTVGALSERQRVELAACLR